MKMKTLPWVVMASALTLSACGGGSSLLGSDSDIDTMRPEAGVVDPSDRPRPPQGEPTLTTDEHFVKNLLGNPELLRGVTLEFGYNPVEMLAAIEPIAATGANALRLMVTSETSAQELEGALSLIGENDMIAIVSLTDDGSALHCKEDSDKLIAAVNTLWLDKWMEVLAQDRFQGRMIINIADGWGPDNIFSAASLGYEDYIDTYKALIRKFRDAGFKLPLMVDAAGCGQDFNAFLVGRGKELLAADSESNLILAANGAGARWDNPDKIIAANTVLANEGVPFVMNAFAGSGVGDYPVDHQEFMAQAQGDRAVSINTPWSTADDGVGYTNAFAEALDLTGGATSLDVYMDRRYLEFMRVSPGSSNYAPNGTTGVSMYLIDADGNRLKLGTRLARELRENIWNKIRFDIPSEIDSANLMDGATGFDQTAVTHVGVEINANGKSSSAKGVIKFDNMNIFPGVPPMYTAQFNSDGDTETWAADNADITVTEGSLQLMPTGGQIDFKMAGGNIGLIDFSNTLNVTARIFLPQEYAGDEIWMQAFGQFGADWSSWNQVTIATSQLVPGDWADVKFTINFNETVSPPSYINTPQAMGIQIGGVATPKTEPLLIDSIVIEDPAARPTKTVTDTQYKATFNGSLNGFVNAGWDDGKIELSNDDGVLVLKVPAGDKGAINKADVNSVQEINLGGNLTVKARVFLPESFANSDFWMMFYFQSGGWQHFEFGEVDMEAFNFGQWNDLEFEITDEDYPEDFARTLSPQMFGFQYSDSVAGEFMVDDIEIIGDRVIDDLQPIYQQDFEGIGSVTDLEVDFTRGALDAGSMLAAKTVGWHVVPFGWTASTWFSTSDRTSGLSIAEDIDGAALTERGEEIVNGPASIAETPILIEID